MESQDLGPVVDHGDNARTPIGDYLSRNRYLSATVPDGSGVRRAGKTGGLDQVLGGILASEGTFRLSVASAVPIGLPANEFIANPVLG